MGKYDDTLSFRSSVVFLFLVSNDAPFSTCVERTAIFNCLFCQRD